MQPIYRLNGYADMIERHGRVIPAISWFTCSQRQCATITQGPSASLALTLGPFAASRFELVHGRHLRIGIVLTINPGTPTSNLGAEVFFGISDELSLPGGGAQLFWQSIDVTR